MALIVTMMIVAIMTAMVVEFTYGVYTTNAALQNWEEAQRLSLVAGSGITLAAKIISDNQCRYSYTSPGKVEIPADNILDGFGGRVLLRVEDENAKFNLNALLWPNGKTNETAQDAFRRLLVNLSLDKTIAAKVADWIDNDSEPRLGNSEEGAKNACMDSVDELLLIKGMDLQTYEKILPYVTVYGVDRIHSNLVNINTASIPVIMSFDNNITEELAERIVHYRALEPFERISDILRVAGFEGSLGQSLMNKMTVKASNLRITSIAEDNKIKRIIECVVEVKGSDIITKYWRET